MGDKAKAARQYRGSIYALRRCLCGVKQSEESLPAAAKRMRGRGVSGTGGERFTEQEENKFQWEEIFATLFLKNMNCSRPHFPAIVELQQALPQQTLKFRETKILKITFSNQFLSIISLNDQAHVNWC